MRKDVCAQVLLVGQRLSHGSLFILLKIKYNQDLSSLEYVIYLYFY